MRAIVVANEVPVPSTGHTELRYPRFRIESLNVGEKYGRGDALTAGYPMVAFYDANADVERFGEKGQFIGGYEALTVLESWKAGRGMNLVTYVPAWKVDFAALDRAIRALFGFVKDWDKER